MSVIKPETSNPVSSIIPKLNAAVKPIIDHKKGIIRIATGHFLSLRSNIPKLKIVVGHGSPKVGEYGYICPKVYPKTG